MVRVKLIHETHFCERFFADENRSVSKSATSLAVPSSRVAARSGLPKAQVASNSLPGTPYGSNQELSKPTLCKSKL